MPITAKWPTTNLAQADVGGEVVNFGTLQLSGAHTDVSATITVSTTIPATWPTTGFLTIDNEIIKYTSYATTIFSGLTRGFESTTAAAHSTGANVGLRMTAQRWNQIVSEVISLETNHGKLADGTSSLPAKSYVTDLDLGDYRIGANREGHAGHLHHRGPTPWADIVAYGADPTGVADSAAAFAAAFAGLGATGGTVYMPPGIFRLASPVLIGGSGITIPYRLIGAGANSSYPTAATKIVVDAGVRGFTVWSGATELSGFWLESLSSGSGTDDGLYIYSASRSHIHDIIVRNFGRYGIHLDTDDSVGNNNLMLFEKVVSSSNKSHGWRVSGTDCNVITFISCEAVSNGGWGLRSEVALTNTYIGWHSSGNTTGAAYINNTSNHFINFYSEGAEGVGVLFDTSSGYCTWHNGTFGNPVIVDSGTENAIFHNGEWVSMRATDVVAVTSLRMPAGVLATPGTFFVNGTTNGFFNAATNVMGITRELSIHNNSANVASAGIIRLPNNTIIKARNAANDADINLLTADSNNRIQLGSSTFNVNIGGILLIAFGVLANYHQIAGSAAASPITFTANGSDTNIDIRLVPKGTGGVQGPVGAVGTPSWTFNTDTDTGMYHSATNGLALVTAGAKVFEAGSATLGFYAVTPVARAAALTQTYATADRTHAAETAVDLATTAVTQTTPWGFASQAQGDALATEFNKLRTDLRDLKQFVNSIVDDLQAYGLEQ